MQQKYTLQHPILTPEYYTHNLHEPDTYAVKALYVSSKRNERPQIIKTEPASLLETLYGTTKLKPLIFKNGFHVYMEPFQGVLMLEENFVMTHFLRQHSLCDYGLLITDAVYGQVCIFGTTKHSSTTIENKDHSVPYEVSEQIFRIYEKIFCR